MWTTAILWVLVQAIVLPDTIWADSIQDVEKGVKAGAAIAEVLSIKEFGTTISTLSASVGPFLGAIGPAVSLLSIFLPKSPSKELLYMKKKFAEMDAKFDRVFHQFGDVKNLMLQTSLRGQYSTYEQKINVLSNSLQHMLKANRKAAGEFKNLFVSGYRSAFHNSARVLWNGMMNSKLNFAYNIPKSAMKYTDYDRRKVQHLMKGVFQLILKGVKVQLAYLKAVGYNEAYATKKRTWASDLKRLLFKIRSIDSEVRRHYRSQSKKDVLYLASQSKKMNHKQVANAVFNLLSRKYYWRDWGVIVYKDVYGGQHHWVKSCYGSNLFRKHGRNIVYTSVTKTKRRFSCSKVRARLWKVSTTTRHWWHGIRKRGAHDVYKNHMPKEMTRGCRYAGAGVIQRSDRPAYKAGRNRFCVVRRRFYNLHVFA